MASFSEESLLKKLEDLNSSQQSIQTLSLWLIHHRKHSKAIVNIWMKDMRRVKGPRKLTLIYLANDVIQNSKRKGPEFNRDFRTVLAESFRNAVQNLDEKSRLAMERVLNIWVERDVFELEFVESIKHHMRLTDESLLEQNSFKGSQNVHKHKISTTPTELTSETNSPHITQQDIKNQQQKSQQIKTTEQQSSQQQQQIKMQQQNSQQQSQHNRQRNSSSSHSNSTETNQKQKSANSQQIQGNNSNTDGNNNNSNFSGGMTSVSNQHNQQTLTQQQATLGGDPVKKKKKLELSLREEIEMEMQENGPGDMPSAEDLIKALIDLESSASSDAQVRERIAALPAEVSDISLLEKLSDTSEVDALQKTVEEACSLLTTYNARLADELLERKRAAKMLHNYIAYQKDSLTDSEVKLTDYKKRLERVDVMYRELKSHVQSLPDFTLLPDVTGGLAPLPSAGDLFSAEKD